MLWCFSQDFSQDNKLMVLLSTCFPTTYLPFFATVSPFSHENHYFASLKNFLRDFQPLDNEGLPVNRELLRPWSHVFFRVFRATRIFVGLLVTSLDSDGGGGGGAWQPYSR